MSPLLIEFGEGGLNGVATGRWLGNGIIWVIRRWSSKEEGVLAIGFWQWEGVRRGGSRGAVVMDGVVVVDGWESLVGRERKRKRRRRMRNFFKQFYFKMKNDFKIQKFKPWVNWSFKDNIMVNGIANKNDLLLSTYDPKTRTLLWLILELQFTYYNFARLF